MKQLKVINFVNSFTEKKYRMNIQKYLNCDPDIHIQGQKSLNSE